MPVYGWVEVVMDHHLLLIRDDVRAIRYIIDALEDRYTVVGGSRSEVGADPGLADSFDLIVIDHSEPRLNALDICSEIRQRNVEAPVVILAGGDQLHHRVA